MRLTVDKRDSILKEEITKKFYDKLTEAELKFKENVKKEVIKTIPSWMTDEIKSSGYIKISNSVNIRGIVDPANVDRYKNQKTGYSIDQCLPCSQYNHFIEVTKRIQNSMDKLTKLREEKEKFKKELRMALYSFTTVKSLLKSLPKLENHFKNDMVSTAVIPVEIIKNIHQQIARP